jgi:hypothetical protein
MKKCFPIFISICILISCSQIFGQKSIKDLKPQHAAALESFLSKNKSYKFLSENSIDAGYLKEMSESFGKTLRPFYQTADFNQDKIADFAVILSRKGARKLNEGVTSEPHRYDYPLAVVIFNGGKNGTFRQAFIEHIEAPLACFLNVEGAKKKELYFGVFQTDSYTTLFSPNGKSYAVKYPETP